MQKLSFVRQLAGVSLVLAALLAGCGSKGVAPTDKLSNVEITVNGAKTNEAYTYAPYEIKLAEEGLQNAKDAIAKENYEEAGKLLDQALLDARLADSKAQSARAKSSAKELSDSVDTLKKEIERK
jgi:hypothetical protein